MSVGYCFCLESRGRTRTLFQRNLSIHEFPGIPRDSNKGLYVNSHSAGEIEARLRRGRGGGLDGDPRQSSIFLIASGGLTAHRIRIRPPQESHSKTSNPKPVSPTPPNFGSLDAICPDSFSSSLVRLSPLPSLNSHHNFANRPRPALHQAQSGISSGPMELEFHDISRLNLRGGTRVASFPIRSSGSKITCIVPSRPRCLRPYNKRPSGNLDKHSVATAGRATYLQRFFS
jgi:hypothetical protein